MCRAMAHRGPDGMGEWADQSHQVRFGHVLLAVQDSAVACRQPLASPSGRFIVCFNGEIYNHQKLRAALGPGLRWRSRSDSETLAAAFDAWGIDGCLRRVDGMYAIAIWDQVERKLHLARDRIGEKPVYCGWQKGVFVFASELKSLEAHPAFEGKLDLGALSFYLRHGYIPSPNCIWAGIKKLLPAHVCTVGEGLPRALSIRSTWNLLEDEVHYAGEERTTVQGAGVATLNALESEISEAVSRATLSAVPVGVFLSGGIDSSLVAALLRSHNSSARIPTFSIGFEDPELDEAPFARRVANFLGTDHHEIYFGSSDVLRVASRLSTTYDEPFADASQIPTVVLCEHARRHVTVALTGDGGDELFMGYPRYPHLAGRIHMAAWMAAPARLIAAMSHGPGWPTPRIRGLITKASVVSRARDRVEAYSAARGHSTALVLSPWQMPPTASDQYRSQLVRMDMAEALAAIDMMEYLPDDLLVKTDRASMSVALETRAPLLSLPVVEMAMRMPSTLKVRDGKQKWPLREVLARHIPRELFDRPKRGFAPPAARWLRVELKDWAGAALRSGILDHVFGLNHRMIDRLWRQHCSGREDHSAVIWNLTMLSEWYSAAVTRRKSASLGR